MARRRNEGGARCPRCGFVFFSASHGQAKGTDVTPIIVRELSDHLCARHGADPDTAAREAREAACRYRLALSRTARWDPLPRQGMHWVRCPLCRSELSMEGEEPRTARSAVKVLRDHLSRDHRSDPLHSHRDASRAVVKAGGRLG